MIDIKTYGAIGNGVADDTAAFQAALNTGGEVYLSRPPVAYRVTNTLNVNVPISLVGMRHKTSLQIEGKFANIFDLNTSDISIEGLSINGYNHRGNVFHYNTGVSSLERIRINNIDGWYCGTAFIDSNHPVNKIITTNISNCMFRAHQNSGVAFNNAWAFIFLDNITFDYVSSGAAGDAPVNIFSGAQGTYLNRVFILGNPTFRNQYGFYFINCEAVHLKECHADSVGNMGFHFNNVGYIQADGITTSLLNSHGVYLYNCSNSILSNVYTQGRAGIADALPGAYGVVMDGCTNVKVLGLLALSFTGAPSVMARSVDSSIAG